MPSNKPEFPRVRLALAASSFFGELPAATLDRLAAAATLARYERPATIVSPEADNDQLWFVLEGGLLVCWNGNLGPVPIAMMGPGSFYNSAAFVEGGTNTSTTARVESHTVLATIPGPALRKQVAADRELAHCVSRLLLNRFKTALSYYADTLTVPLPNRLARRLLGQAMATRHEEETEIELRTSQTQLARIVGASRSKVNAELREMEKQGMLRLGYRAIVLLDMGKLCTVAGAGVPAF
jgi:CRP/FNR family cyclic AMP-dependent transcriptional regulator